MDDPLGKGREGHWNLESASKLQAEQKKKFNQVILLSYTIVLSS